MDNEVLFQQRNRILQKLHGAVPGTEEYANFLEDLNRIDAIIAKNEQMDRDRTELNHKIDAEEERLKVEQYRAENEKSAAKRESWLKAGAIILGSVIAGLFGLAGIDKTVELEEDEVPSRNGYSIAKGMFPRMK